MKKLLNRKKIAVLLGLLLAAWNLPVYAEDTGAAEANPPEYAVETLPGQPEEQPPEETEIPDSDIPESTSPEETLAPDETNSSDRGETDTDSEEDPEQEPSRLLKAAQEINVKVPAQGQMIINPYGLPVESEGAKTTAQIINPVQELTNTGSQPVLVDVRVVGSVPEGSEAVLVDREPAPDVKEVFLYAEFQNDPTAWLDGYKAGYNQVPATPEGAASEGVLTLEAEETGYFRIFGEMSTEPFWEKSDTFDVSLAFSFTALGGGEDQAGEKTEPVPTNPTKPETPENPDNPEAPNATPETPESPADPDGPTDPEPAEPKPTEPVDPTEPPDGTEIPEEPEPPTETVEPSEPAVPETPGDTGEPEEQDPSDPSQAPEEPGTADDPETPEEPAPPSAADEPGESEEAVEPEPPTKPDSQTEPEA